MEQIQNETDEISLKELIQKAGNILGYLKTQWWKLFLISLLGGIGGYVYAKLQKPKYTAKLTFALAEGGDKMGGISSIASQFGLDLMGGGSAGAFSGDNLLELMKSRLLIEKTLLTSVDSFGQKKLLIDQYLDFDRMNRNRWFRRNPVAPVEFGKGLNKDIRMMQQDSLLREVCNHFVEDDILKVGKVDKKLSIVNVIFTSEDEWFARTFTEKLTQNVTEFYIETKTGQMRKNIQMMEHKVDSIKSLLGKSMYGVALESDKNQFLVKGVPRVPQIKKQLEIQVLTLAYGEMIKNLEMTRTIMAKDQPLIQLIDIPKLPLEKKKVKITIAVGIGFFSTLVCTIIVFLLGTYFKHIL